MVSLLDRYGWHEWLCHSNFSFLVGASHPYDLIKRGWDLQYRGLGITDYDGVYGLARSHIEWKRLKQNEANHKLRLFYGTEIHLNSDHDLPIPQQQTLVMVARSWRGYQNICQIISLSHIGGKNRVHIPIETLCAQDCRDIVVLQPMRGIIRSHPTSEVAKYYAHLRDRFVDQLYFVISRHLHPSEDAWISPTIRLSQNLSVPCLLSSDVYFHRPSQKKISDLMQAIRRNQTLGQVVSQTFVNGERCLQSLSKIEQRFQGLSVYQSSLQASRELADSCQFSLDELRYHYPKEMIPEHHTAMTWLEELTWLKAKERYGDPLPDKFLELLCRELTLIKELEFADYFLTVWDIVRWARQQNILCQGRGSAANSAVCFVLGITSVDPASFDLLFERFISAERGDPPDIDVDFEHERREEVIQYIYERYGRHRAAMVANVITFQKRGAMGASGKALGIPMSLVKTASKMMDSRRFRDLSTLVQSLKSDEGCAYEDIPWTLWGELMESILGFPRHLGLHSGGFVISDQPLDRLVPQEPATMPGRTVIQWSKDDIEALGFFKIDILALGMLTAVRKSFDLIAEYYHREISLSEIPADDPKTYAMIQRADTVGIFQIESRAQMSMLPRLKPRCFYDLVVEVAIIRPGPIQGGLIHPYLRRRNGLDPVVFVDERLRPILARTLGVPIFQEQVMRIAMEVGGFSPGEADALRRNISSWKIKGDLSPLISKLMVGMQERGISEEFIKQMTDQMRAFSEYGFPESHAVSFALIAYGSSWLKCHYPAAFFAAVLNSQPMGFYTPYTLIQAARRSGVSVLPVCVNHSQDDCSLERLSSAHGAPLFAIRLGLGMVRGLSQEARLRLLDRRAKEGGQWQDLQHFLKTSSLYRHEIVALTAASALACFGVSRRDALWIAEAYPYSPFLTEREKEALFPRESDLETLQMDFASTGVFLGDHPSLLMKKECWHFEVALKQMSLAVDLEKKLHGQQVYVFGMVIVRQSPPTAKGMVFFTLEDETGFLNLVFTPQVYGHYLKVVDRQSFLCVRGILQKDRGAHSILVKGVYAPLFQKARILALDSGANRSVVSTSLEGNLPSVRQYV